MAKPTGYEIWRGPSLLDGAPIVVIMTLHSDNVKTGDMVQTWILRADMSPVDALKTGADESICGDCKHRQSNGGACYVQVGRAPQGVYGAFSRGRYPQIDAETAALLVEGRMVRLGAYGDPAAVPFRVWLDLTKLAKGHTGYTHQWRNTDLSRWQLAALRQLTMASADTATEARDAQAMGWRTFRVMGANESALARESVCPASEEAGHKVNCETCGACNGAGTGRKGSIRINVHGPLAARFVQSLQV